MKTTLQLEQEEEEIRLTVSQLPDLQRKEFHDRFSRQYKDPDTYATLNFLFVAGLHHFYLGKWIRGAFNLFIFTLGVTLIFSPLAPLGWALVIGISLIELYALFMSQRIAQNHNNQQMRQILQQMGI